MLQKLRQWIRKLSFPISLLLMGVLFFTWTDNWQVYTDPIRELYNRGVQLAGGARKAVSFQWMGSPIHAASATGVKSTRPKIAAST